MNEQSIERFLAVVDAGSILNAGRGLGRPATSLSRDLNCLEKDLGVKLLVRTAAGVTVTPAGQEFQVEAVAMLIAMRRARENAQRTSAGGGPVLRIGHVGGASYRLLPLCLRAVREAFPLLRFVVSEGLTASHVAATSTNLLDVALVRPPVDDDELVEEGLVDEAIMVALPAGHYLADQVTVSVDDLRTIGLVSFPKSASPGSHARILALLRQADAGDVEMGLHLADHPASEQILVAAGLGAALVASGMVGSWTLPGVVIREIHPAIARLPLSVTWRKHDSSPYVAETVRVLQGLARPAALDFGDVEWADAAVETVTSIADLG